MRHDVYTNLAENWKAKNAEKISNIAIEFRNHSLKLECDILVAFSYSLSGKTLEAYNLYSKIKGKSDDKLIQNLFEIDFRYCETKLQRKSAKLPIKRRLFPLGIIFLSKHSAFSKMLIHHGLYEWYIAAFWYNHLQSLVSAVLLLFFGFITNQKEARIHGKFLLGHLANVKGFPRIGVPLVTSAFKKHEEIGFWIRSQFLSYMAYGLYMVGQVQDIIPQILKEAKISLGKCPDPFYEILLNVSILRFSSQIGDIETSEEVATVLIKFAETTKIHRFYYSSKADLALCYGIRGLYWKCDEILIDLESYQENEVDPVEAGSFFRLRGWAYFFVGKYEKALADADRALFYFSKAKSFFTAQKMSEILRIISLFRLDLDGCLTIEDAINITRIHSMRIKKFKNRLSRNSILLKVLAEEEASLLASFGRFWQPGYSRDNSVNMCQQRLHLVLNEVALASSDNIAWSIILKQISAPLSIELELLEHCCYKPEFEVRNTHGEKPGIEVVIDRSNGNENKYDLVKFSIVNGVNLLSILDAMYTLLPTLNCLFKIRDQQYFILSAERDRTFNIVASQVAHDIRSPLSALNMISSVLSEVSEEKRLVIWNASKRINDIANQLLSKAKEAHSKISSESIPKAKEELISSLIDVIVSEKRIQYRDKLNLEIEANLQNSYGLYAIVDSTEIKRTLSNLINNSVEAFKNDIGKVTVGIEPAGEFIKIYVVDNGGGIPKQIIDKLGERGISYGKAGTDSGSGLGIYYAKKTIEEIGGQFLIESEEGVGTKVSLLLKVAIPPKWFCEKLVLKKSTTVVCIDDDVSIHNVWNKKFELNRVVHFSSGEALEKWICENRSIFESSIFLMDYELLGQAQTGLDLIEKLGLNENAILVTSRFEEKYIQERCIKLGVRLISKGMVSLVPIELEMEKIKYDACLIDDDALIRMTWNLAAKEKNKTFISFASFELFTQQSQAIDKTTPIFIDLNLQDGIKGTDVAKDLSLLGYSNLYLATGYEVSSIEIIPDCIIEVKGKSPIFI